MLFLCLILTLTSLTSAVPRPICPESMDQEKQICTFQILDKITGDDFKVTEVCDVIDETVLECTEGFAQCQMDDEIQ